MQVLYKTTPIVFQQLSQVLVLSQYLKFSWLGILN